MQTDERVVRGVFSLLVGILVCGCWTLPTCADEVVLANGDRLEGQLFAGSETIVLRVDTPRGTEGSPIRLVDIQSLTNGRAFKKDVVILKDGTRLEGELETRNAPKILMNVDSVGRSTLEDLSLKDIRSMARSDEKAAVANQKNVFGYVHCRSLDSVSSEDLATATISGIRKSLEKDDKLTIVVIDGPNLDSADACRLADAIALAFHEYGNDRLLAHVHNAREAAAVVTLTFPRIVVAPDATLRGYVAEMMEQAHRDKLLRCVRSCNPKRVALAEGLCNGTSVVHNEDTGWHVDAARVQGDRFGTNAGVLELSAFDMASTKTALALGKDHNATHAVLGLTTNPRYLNRTTPVRATSPVASGGPTKLVEARIEKYNAGLAEAKEGIDAFKENGWWLWNQVEPYWRARRPNLDLMDPDVKDRSGDAQQLMLNGLGDAVRQAVFLGKKMKTMNDPRLGEASKSFEVLNALEEAITNDKDHINFKKKCEAVLELDPV